MNFHAVGILLAIAATFLSSEAALTKKCRRRRENGCKAWGTGTNPGLTDEEKQKIVDLHNEYRASVARGEVRGAKGLLLPPATNMKTITWDDDLAKAAQDQSDECQVQSKDTNELMFGQTQMSQIIQVVQPAETNLQAIQSSFNKLRRPAENFEADWVDDGLFNADPSLETMLYALLIKAQVDKIGCGYDNTTYNGEKKFILVCNYGPGVFWWEHPLYQKACSKNGHCCNIADPLSDTELTSDDKEAIVDLHNKYRASVARGEVRGAKGLLLPPATNMVNLTWDDDLAKMAQDQVAACQVEKAASNEELQGKATQLLSSWTPKKTVMGTIESIFNHFQGLAKHFEANMVDGLPFYVWVVWAQYALLISAKVNKIGCGYHHDTVYKGEKKSLLVCNYGPAFEASEQVYKRGCHENDQCCKDGYPVWDMKLTQADKDIITQAHKGVRDSVVKGTKKVSGGELLLRTTSLDISWSDKLAKKAQKVLENGCDCELAAEDAGNSTNTARLEGTTMLNSKTAITDMIQGWIDESGDFKTSMVDSFPEDSSAKSFAQMIWQKTTKVGCGFMVRKKGDIYYRKLVCKYSHGLKVGHKVYTICDIDCCKYLFIPLKRGLNPEEKEGILNLFNDIRRSVAKGMEQGQGGKLLPQASNTSKLTWSDEVAKRAQNRVDTCDDMEIYSGNSGEITTGTQIWDGLSTLNTTTNIINRWRQGARSCSEAVVDSRKNWYWDERYFIQMIRQETRKVGCGFILLESNVGKEHNFLCYFDPNIKEGKMYEKGCTGSDCTDEDDGLCVD